MAPRRAPPPPPGTNNEIRGPTSALTSFLREQGITSGPGLNRGRQRDQVAATPATPPTVAEEEEQDELEEPQQAVASTSTSVAVASSGGSSKRKKAPSAAAAAKKKKKSADDDGDDEGEGDGIFSVGGKKEVAKPGRYDNRMPGAIAVCGECGKKFTVTKYTVSNPLGPGMLCMPCSNLSIDQIGKGPGTKKAAPKKKRPAKSIEEKEFKVIKTLQQFCIAVIGKHIDAVEDFGHIGPQNRDRIAKIVSKHRALCSANLDLFLDMSHTELSLYDCTSLQTEDLASIATFCTHLESLTLKMCGRMDDTVLETWGAKLKELRHLYLYAPYLVTANGWKAYFETLGEHHALDGFGLRQSARFTEECLTLLVSRCPNLSILQLSEVGKMHDGWLPQLHSLKNLTSLDISRAGVPEGTSLTDDAVVALLEQVGENLVELVLDQNYNLTDRVLIEGVKIHCPSLRSLSLRHLDQIQSTGLQDLFTAWVNTGLVNLSLHRVLHLENEAISAVLAHSGPSLVSLDLHSVDNIEDKVLYELADTCVSLEVLDVSFVRSVDNFVIKAMQDKLEKLKLLFVHGNNRVTQDVPRKKGVSLRGLENELYVEL